METDDTFGFLVGSWQLRREIHDAVAARTYVFEAMASLTPGSPSPTTGRRRGSYEEAGELRTDGYAGRAGRRLFFEEDDGAVTSYFADGHNYIPLDLRRGSFFAEHLCGPDRYEIETVVSSPESFEESWSVVGPAKCYVALGRFVRPGGSDR